MLGHNSSTENPALGEMMRASREGRLLEDGLRNIHYQVNTITEEKLFTKINTQLDEQEKKMVIKLNFLHKFLTF